MTAHGEPEDKPIPGPSTVGPEYTWERDELKPAGAALKTARFFIDLVRVPVHWIHDNLVEPYRGPKYYWYHQKFARVLPVDECWIDDGVCLYEATKQMQRDLLVDKATLDLLRYRRDSCGLWYRTVRDTTLLDDRCLPLKETYDREEINFYLKYGRLHHDFAALDVYNKQKHRMIVERRKALEELKVRKGEADKPN